MNLNRWGEFYRTFNVIIYGTLTLRRLSIISKNVIPSSQCVVIYYWALSMLRYEQKILKIHNKTWRTHFSLDFILVLIKDTFNLHPINSIITQNHFCAYISCRNLEGRNCRSGWKTLIQSTVCLVDYNNINYLINYWKFELFKF